MPTSLLNTSTCGRSSSPFHRNNIESIGTHNGRLSPVSSHIDIGTPPSPRRLAPGYSPKAGRKSTEQSKHVKRPQSNGRSPTPSKHKWWNLSSNNITNDVSQQALPPQVRADGGLSPVPLFKRTSLSTSSLGSVPDHESCDASKLYVTPGRLSPLPTLDAKHDRSKKMQIKYTKSHSPTPPKKLSAASSTAALQFHSPQAPRKRAFVQNSSMTPPLPRRKSPPTPLVLTPSGNSFSGSSISSSPPHSPGPPRRPAPLPPFDKSPSANRRLSLAPPVPYQDTSSPKLPPKPAHLKSSPASSPRRRSPVPPHFTYTPPASPTRLSLSSANESPPIVPMRVQETRLSRPLPVPPITTQPRSVRPPLPLPKPAALQSPPLIVNRNSPVCGSNKKATKLNKANRKQPRRSPQVSRISQKVAEKGKKDGEEEEEGCCTACLRDCFAELPEYLLDIFC